jgi:hypothetical protein
VGCTEAQVKACVRRDDGTSDEHAVYMCQATRIPEATTLLRWWDVRQYIEDYFSRNVGLCRMLCGFLYMGYNGLINAGIGLGVPLRWLYDRVKSLWGGIPYPRRKGHILPGQPTPSRELNLQPGDFVRVRSFGDILATLNVENKNRGMYFDAEEVPHCGKVFQVVSRVNQIVDERTGRMLKFGTGSVILAGAYCQSRYSEKRLFCPRSIYTFWRETWLERVPPPPNTGASAQPITAVSDKLQS